MGWLLGESEEGERRDAFVFWGLEKKSSLAQTIQIPETEMPETGDVEQFEILRIDSWLIEVFLQWWSLESGNRVGPREDGMLRTTIQGPLKRSYGLRTFEKCPWVFDMELIKGMHSEYLLIIP